MKEHIAHSGAWGLAAIMIVVTSRVFHRYVASNNWREWGVRGGRAGLLHHAVRRMRCPRVLPAAAKPGSVAGITH